MTEKKKIIPKGKRNLGFFHKKNRGDLIKSVDDLTIYLIDCEFQCFVPRSKTWSHAFLKRNQFGDCLIILIRKNGIDYRFYSRDENLSEYVFFDANSNNFSMKGGILYRNHYCGCLGFLIGKTVKISSGFCEGKQYLRLMMQEDGVGYKKLPEFNELKVASYKENKRRINKFPSSFDLEFDSDFPW